MGFILMHACEQLLMGLLWYGFKDAIREGDGPAVMSYWKVLMVIFKLTGHSKYVHEIIHYCSIYGKLSLFNSLQYYPFHLIS